MTGSPKNYTPIYCIALLTWMSAAAYGQSPGNTPPQKEQSAAPTQSTNKESQTGMPVLPRGKKLVLKDGPFQLVRSYQRSGERIRYYSAERRDSVESPAAMVDWDATAKTEAAEQIEVDELARKIYMHVQAQ